MLRGRAIGGRDFSLIGRAGGRSVAAMKSDACRDAAPNAAELVAWMRGEGIVDLADGFREDGDLFAAGLDSMAVMQLVVAVEEAFGVVLGPEDLTRDGLATPQALAALVLRKSVASHD
jgi:acyl carrier protein